MTSRLGDLRLYKFDVPFESDVGVLLISVGEFNMGTRFRLSRYMGRKQRRAGLSKSFVELVSEFLFLGMESNITKESLDYIVSNFSFKDLEIVPPACPVLVFHFNIIGISQDHVPQVDITGPVLAQLKTRDSILTAEDAKARLVPIAPPTTEIVCCYQSSDSCCLCERGYPKEDEIVHKTKCNHIFHATCISRHLLRTAQCPVCSAHLPPVDIRTLLFL